ncbi:MAG: hypothetical protein EX271_05325 [Acidimicrobiales bacterium]|nr:hypothetical protein [Hyphomonadaceae bacterium]RZV42711.1 MAG: hypothetical protein EX271_05325 [Acidimicrobiales bacterium]
MAGSQSWAQANDTEKLRKGHELSHTIQQKKTPVKQRLTPFETEDIGVAPKPAAMNKGEVISEIAKDSGEHKTQYLSFQDAIDICRSEADLQACVDKKTGQNRKMFKMQPTMKQRDNDSSISRPINSTTTIKACKPESINSVGNKGICKKTSN